MIPSVFLNRKRRSYDFHPGNIHGGFRPHIPYLKCPNPLRVLITMSKGAATGATPCERHTAFHLWFLARIAPLEVRWFPVTSNRILWSFRSGNFWAVPVDVHGNSLMLSPGQGVDVTIHQAAPVDGKCATRVVFRPLHENSEYLTVFTEKPYNVPTLFTGPRLVQPATESFDMHLYISQ